MGLVEKVLLPSPEHGCAPPWRQVHADRPFNLNCSLFGKYEPMNSMSLGLAALLLSAICGGLCPLPLRIRKRYEPEHMLIVSFTISTIIAPLIFASLRLDGWQEAMRQVGMATILTAVAIGFGWGLAAITWAQGITRVGMGLALGIIMGINTLVGSLTPMLRKWAVLPGDAVIWTFIGMTGCIVGVVFCGWAGYLREHVNEQGRQHQSKPITKPFMIGITFCVISGVLSAFANIGYDYAQPIKQALEQSGTDPRFSTIAAWMPVWWGGGVAILIVSFLSLIRRGTLNRFTGPGAGRDILLAILVMSTCQFLGQSSYGVGSYYLGEKLGRTVGWAISIGLSLMVANILGFVIGEWKGCSRSSRHTLYAGLAILTIAMVCLAYANSRI
jgi:L-rhamnose-H+ transport protein